VRTYAHKSELLLVLEGGGGHNPVGVVVSRVFRLPYLREARNFSSVSPVSMHMRTLRLLTVLVTLLTLPGYGFAGLGHVRTCQAQMNAPDRVVMAGDCCPGKADQSVPCKRSGEAPGKDGSCTLCKAGYNCKNPQTYEPTHLVAIMVLPARPILTASLSTLVISHSSNGLWRPPRSI
jgi:hypothetical protein